jgi:hypothetical protein
VASDFLIFLLGFLLTLLELNKEKHVEVERSISVPAQIATANEPIRQSEIKSQNSISFLNYLLVSIIAVIFFDKVKKVFKSEGD